jgi:TusA-related sulfurtransferase
MPVIRTQALIKKMQLGEVLEVICTDPGTMHDIPSWCKMYGHTVLSAREHESEFYFLIEVKHVEEEREAKVW